MNLKILILNFMKGYDENEDMVQVQLMNFLELDEKCMASFKNISQHQDIIKCQFDKRTTFKAFSISDLVLMWVKVKEKLGTNTKFEHLWIGPYQITKILGENTFRLGTLDEELVPFSVNRRFFKHYFEA